MGGDLGVAAGAMPRSEVRSGVSVDGRTPERLLDGIRKGHPPKLRQVAEEVGKVDVRRMGWGWRREG